MKKSIIVSIVLVLMGVLLFSSCNSLKKMAKNHAAVAKYEVNPNPVEMHADMVTLNLKGNYPPKYFYNKAIVMLQPTLVYEGGSKALKPIILKGEKAGDTEGTLIGSKTGGSFTYTDKIEYTDEMEQAQVIFNPIGYTAKALKNLENAKVADAEQAKALPKSVPFGDTKVAEGTMATASRLSKEAIESSLEADAYEKETILENKVTIYYKVDLHNLDMNLPLNKKAELKRSISALDSMIGTGMAIKEVAIHSWASPEGEESRNQNLSQNRSKTATKFLNDTYNKVIKKMARAKKVKPASIKQDLSIRSESMGEDWDGFIASLRASDIAEKNTIINVISSHTDKLTREQEIRNMTVIYQQIEENILPPLRRSEIRVSFLEPKKTDEQMARLSLTSPDSLNLEELLYSATLTQERDNQITIYESAMRIYSQDIRAYVNASSLYLAKKNYDKAKTILQEANALNANHAKIHNNFGVIAMAEGDLKNAKSYFETAKNLGSTEAVQNYAAFLIKSGDYSAAAATSAPCSYSLALSQIMEKQYPSANQTLACIKEQTPEVLYLKAVCAARESKNTEAIEALKAAIKGDKALQERARKDVEFKALSQLAEFTEILR